MDLDSYIARHRDEWHSLEEATARSYRRQSKGAEITELIRLYLRASSHLAEVQSRYHDPGLEEYLNALVGRAHAAIYGAESRSLRSFLATFGSRYRAALRRTLPFILVVAGLLGGLILLVDVWVAASPEASAGVLPAVARDAVQRDDGAVHIDVPGPALSTLIFQNNVRVAFLAFALGITLGVGTLFVIGQNAVFIGLLAGAFHAAGKAPIFWGLVLPHGFLELTAICIAGGAGLRMGWAIIDPGDRLRRTALAEESRDAVLVVVGVVPAFLIAALIEGFVTGRTGQPLVEVAGGALVVAVYLAFLFRPLPRVTRPSAATTSPAP